MKILSLAVAATLALSGCSLTQSESVSSKLDTTQANAFTKKPTNILWIYIEDQNAWISPYGDNTVSTPTIDQFAKDGVVFEHMMMPGPVCSATRSALITGAYQTTNGLHNHRSSRSNIAPIFLPKGYKTMPELFIDAGYKTFNIGKDDYNFNYNRGKMYNAHGFEKAFQGEFAGKEFDWAKELKNTPFFGQIQLRGGKYRRSVLNKLKVPHTDPDKMGDKLPPYYPNTAAYRREWANHYDTQMGSDRELNQILKQLKENGLLENTAVFYFSDHGMVLPRHKQYLYEEGVHVPFIVNWPAGNDELRKLGSRRSGLFSGLDISATTLALAGIEIPDYYDGKNFFSQSFNGRDYVISAKDRMDHTVDRSRAVRSERYRYIRNFNPERPYLQSGYRDSRDYMKQLKEAKPGTLNDVQKIFTAKVKPVEELYDLVNDPYQVKNLATEPKYAAALKEHRQVLLDWIAKTDDKGAYPESDAAVREVLMLWGKKCDSPECDSYRARYGDKLNMPADKVHPIIPWPDYMPKPKDKVYEEVEDIYRAKFH